MKPRDRQAAAIAMEAEGVVVREVVNAIPPWVEYELTEKGKDIYGIIEAVELWSRKWVSIPG